jgi:hypothetical protein
VCRQLAAFYKASNAISEANGPWDEEGGWELTTTKGCEQLIPASSMQQPAYCAWYGITCCTAAELAADTCSAIGAVAAIDLPLNNLNASISGGDFLQPVQQLHACGLTTLNLEANSFSGTLSDAWGRLVHLRKLDLGESLAGQSIRYMLYVVCYNSNKHVVLAGERWQQQEGHRRVGVVASGQC